MLDFAPAPTEERGSLTRNWILPQSPPGDNKMIKVTNLNSLEEYTINVDGRSQLPLELCTHGKGYKVTVRSQHALTFPTDDKRVVMMGYKRVNKLTATDTASQFPESERVTIRAVLRSEVQRSHWYTATVYWAPVSHTPDSYMVKVTEMKTSKEIIFNVDGSKRQFSLPTRLIKAGNEYKVTVTSLTGMNLSQSHGKVAMIAQKTISKASHIFKAEFTHSDLIELLRRSVTFIKKTRYDPILFFYRNKPPAYYEDIMMHHSGIMIKYMKDHNGDQASCINGTVEGLFFGVDLDRSTGNPPLLSHFGTQRLLIPAPSMFTWAPCLYFADFYCNNRAHYVTLVMTKPGSVADRLCREKLISLNPRGNPFLMQDSMGDVHVTKGIHVEVLFTENVDIPWVVNCCGGFWARVQATGTSRPNGIPKNRTCKTCNLYMD